MESLINNFINGNLSTAQKQATRFGLQKIRDAFIEIGYSFEKAQRTADYLKGKGTFQDACDAK